MKKADTSDREIITTRLINAPRELVFEAWTDPVHIAKWWGPRGFTNTVHEMNVKPGGVWRFTMHGPDGVDYPNKIVYSEVVRPERLVYAHSSDKENDPFGFDVIVTFGDQGGKTLVTLCSILKTPEARQFVIDNHGAIEGAKQTLERLSEFLADSEPLLLITRIFDAPRELVFNAWTDPKSLVKWHAPNGCSIQYRSIDIREGGTFHSCIKIPSGEECWCRGVYLEVKKPERIVYTIALADENGKLKQPDAVGKDPDWPAETTVTVTFDVIAGKTKLTLRQNVSEAVAKRTGAHPSWLQMLDRLAGVIKE